MSEYIKATLSDVIPTALPRVACGGPEFSRHPRVFLTVKGGEKDEVVCPYCGRIFRYKASEKATTHPAAETKKVESVSAKPKEKRVIKKAVPSQKPTKPKTAPKKVSAKKKPAPKARKKKVA